MSHIKLKTLKSVAWVCMLSMVSVLPVCAGASAGFFNVPEFDGVRNHISIPHHEDLNPGTENWTLEFWVKMLADFELAANKFMAKRDGAGAAGGFYAGSRFAPACDEGNRQNLDYRRSIPQGEWTHIAVQIDRDEDKLRVFVNGVRVAEQDSALTGAVSAESEFIIGGDSTGRLQGNRCRIRDVRVWKGVRRSGEQIKADMHRTLSGEEEGLARYWPLDEGEGETVRDRGPNRNHGEFRDGAEWVLAESPFAADLPAAVEVSLGDDVVLGPVEIRSPRGEPSYQWYFNYGPLEGETADTLRIAGIEEEQLGTYYAAVDDDRGFTPVESARVRLAEPDWPMWRYDPARSADTPHMLSEELHLHWVRELPEPAKAWRFQWDDRGKLDFDVSYAPVVKGGRIFVPSNVNDSLTAYSIEDGSEEWRFYADGPVRLAPAAWRDRVYFVSDDGHLYCLDADTGELVWKFRGGPSAHSLLGNERIINFWSARGGPVIKEGKIYFAAGVWPLHGVFIYALDAASGDVIWVNDTTSSDYVALPHGGADGFGGLAPQGYLAASEDRLIIGGGRTPYAVLDRRTGEFKGGEFRGPKGHGDYAVHAVDGGGMGMMRNRMLSSRVNALSGQIDGEVFYKLAARGRLFVMTVGGTLYCFGSERKEPVRHAHRTEPAAPRADEWADAAEYVLGELGENRGYALMLGAGSGDFLRELLLRSEIHIAVVERDPSVVRSLRDELAGAGLYGRRAAVIESDPAGFIVQPYLFSMVLSEDAGAAGISDSFYLNYFLDRVRPYGGVAYLGATGSAELSEAADWVYADRVSVDMRRDHLFARRGGPLTGAGEWTHNYHDAANTLVSRDRLVRLPLGVLWFGGPNNHNILPRHAGGPRPQVAAGRQVFLGVETIGARCVYTGRQLWEAGFPGIGHPFTNLELEEQWEGGRPVYMTNIPGSTYIGSPFVTLSDSIYLRHGGQIHRLDPASGRTLSRFPLPGRSAEELYGEGAPDWGHIRVQGDFLVTTSEPHLFEDQALGWTDSWSGTSSKRLIVMDRYSGEVLWDREADVGFRHNAVIASGDTVFLIDGLSRQAVEHLARRGEDAGDASRILALDIRTGEEKWSTDSDVFGTFLLYSEEYDILVEGGSRDLRHTLEDEPRTIAGRRGSDGSVLWEGGIFVLPAALLGEQLVPGRPGQAISVLTGERWHREQPHTGRRSVWGYRRAYGCNTLNASEHLLLFRSGYAGFFDLEHDSGTGNFSGFRSGCTANLIAADGVLNALDYTRTCTCSYAHQTSLALVHMPGDINIEDWTYRDASRPDPARHGVNFGAPGRRVDETGRIWFDEPGTHRRHASAVKGGGAGVIEWVAASGRQVEDGDEPIELGNVIAGDYTVRLHFAEPDETARPGQRVFDVLVNGEKKLAGVDIVRIAGGALRGVVEEVAVSSTGGSMTFELKRAEGSELAPVISGIELTVENISD